MLRSSPLRWLLLGALLVGCADRGHGSAATAEPAPAPPAEARVSPPAPAAAIDAGLVDESSVRPGINDNFLNPELDYERWKKTFEGESREVYAARAEVVAALELRPGMAVADIGAGTGFYLWAFAEAVGTAGQVYGVEISPRFLDRLHQQVREHGIGNAAIVTGSERSVELAEGSVDLIFTCDTYHHFEYPQHTLASIRRALRPGGAFVVVDFERVEGKSSDWILKHVRAGKEVVRQEIEQAGFELDRELAIPGFSENYVLRFRAVN